MVSYIVSFVLFALALIIFFVVRASDQKTSGLKKVKLLVDQLRSDIHSYDTTFKQDIAEVDLKIHEQQNEVRELIQTSAAQIVQLKNYSDDFSSLHGAMAGYQNALTALARLTEDADAKVAEVDSDVAELEKLKETIEAFRGELASIHDDAVNQLNTLHDTAVSDMKAAAEEATNDFLARTNTAKAEFAEHTDSAKSELEAVMEEKLAGYVKNVEQLEGGFSSKIEQMEDEFKADTERALEDFKATVSVLETKATSVASTASESIQSINRKLSDYQQAVTDLSERQAEEGQSIQEKDSDTVNALSGSDSISSPEDIAALMDDISAGDFEKTINSEVFEDAEDAQPDTNDHGYEIQNMTFDFSEEKHT